MSTEPWTEPVMSARLVFRDGTIIRGSGIGAVGSAVGELCFNTAITGYQEILTDPSYAGQIITFTFPHIGNVGANEEDIETVDGTSSSGVRGCVIRAPISEPANWRAAQHLDRWLKVRGIVGIAGVDTRALTVRLREGGATDVVVAHDPAGDFDEAALNAELARFPGLLGMDLVPAVTAKRSHGWHETPWTPGVGFGRQDDPQHHVVVIDYGVKRNILRLMAAEGCRLTVLPATATAEDVLSHEPDGVFLSNGPGDPAATGAYAISTIRGIVESGLPIFGICLGHQMLALALGAKTLKMHQGHHGANHPVRDHTTGKVEITSMNHGFAVDSSALPADVEETHVSLFDGSNCGIRLKGRPVYSVQHHPEASPGPMDSHYLFRRFTDLMRERKGLDPLPENG